jgi:hypothetical protein
MFLHDKLSTNFKTVWINMFYFSQNIKTITINAINLCASFTKNLFILICSKEQ